MNVNASTSALTAGESLNSTPVSSEPGGKNREKMTAALIICAAGLLYFLGGAFRYYAFRAGALDLGFFDQAVYLISTGQVPYSTILSTHILADHAAFVLYLVAQLYRIHPTIYWLFVVQATCMAGAAWPLSRLAREAGVSASMTRAIIVAYLLYPVVATATLRDFYPEVIAIPAFLAAILCARQNRPVWFVIWVLLGLLTKEVMAVTFATVGLYLVFYERRKAFGWTAFALSVVWYPIATKLAMPYFGHGHYNNGFRFFSYMGDTPGQILHTMLLRPQVPLKWLASPKTVIYVMAIFVPVFWGLSKRSIAPILCAAPCIAINLLSKSQAFRNPFFHYSWPVVPFIFLGVIAAVAHGEGIFKRARPVIIWSAVLVLIGGVLRVHEVSGKQLRAGASGDEKRRLLAMIDDQGGVLATHQTAPHLTHRKVIQFVYDNTDPVFKMPPDSEIEWVLLDFDEDSILSVEPFAAEILQKYQKSADFHEIYQHGALHLFRRSGP